MVGEFPCNVSFFEIAEDQARELARKGLESCVGHAVACTIYAARLGVEVPMRRVNTRLANDEVALLGQYMGPRLAEGKVMTEAEMAAAPMKWLLVYVCGDGVGTLVASCMDHGVYLKYPEVLEQVLYPEPSREKGDGR